MNVKLQKTKIDKMEEIKTAENKQYKQNTKLAWEAVV